LLHCADVLAQEVEEPHPALALLRASMSAADATTHLVHICYIVQMFRRKKWKYLILLGHCCMPPFPAADTENTVFVLRVQMFRRKKWNTVCSGIADTKKPHCTCCFVQMFRRKKWKYLILCFSTAVIMPLSQLLTLTQTTHLVHTCYFVLYCADVPSQEVEVPHPGRGALLQPCLFLSCQISNATCAHLSYRADVPSQEVEVPHHAASMPLPQLLTQTAHIVHTFYICADVPYQVEVPPSAWALLSFCLCSSC
jgi:hypothetical protein